MSSMYSSEKVTSGRQERLTTGSQEKTRTSRIQEPDLVSEVLGSSVRHSSDGWPASRGLLLLSTGFIMTPSTMLFSSLE